MEQPTRDSRAGQQLKYAAPTITVMDEDEVLKAFQLTSAMSSWWVPGGPVST